MRVLKYMALGAFLCIWGGALQAAHPMGMYEAEVEVADQGRKARAEAMGEAMGAVLLKVGGNGSVLEEEVIRDAMVDASRYVQQYRYHSEDIPPAERERGEGAAQQRLLLRVSFDSDSIDNLLRRFGFNVWSAARPSTLVWLAVEEGGRRVLVGADDQGLVREVLEAEAQRRAIPLRLPLLDLTDQSKLRAIDVWGGFVDNIEAASARYEAQAILIGKLYPVGKTWEARWTLLYQGGQNQWQSASSEVSRAIASGVDGTADYLSAYFSSTTYRGVEQLVVNVDRVSGMAAFRRVNDYLLSLHGITAVKLRRADARSASFLLDIEGGRDAVLQAIQMGDLLVEVEAPVEEPVLLPAVEALELPPGKTGFVTDSPEVEQGAVPPSQAAASGDSLQGVEAGSGSEEPGVVPPQAAPIATPPIVEHYFRLLP